MQPRNLTFFAIPKGTMPTPNDRELIAECALKPVGPLEMSSRGFVKPYAGDEMVATAVLSSTTDLAWFTVGGEDRMLPSAVVNAELGKRLAKIEEQEGRKPGGRARKRIKDYLIHEMLPKAFVKPSRVDGYIVANMGFVAVDTASRKQAEGAVSEVRSALGSFPALPLNAGVPPSMILTNWLSGAIAVPDNLTIGSDCTLATLDGSKVRITGSGDTRGDAAQHLEAGMQVTRLGLVLEDKISFELGEDLVVRKFKLLDGAVDDMAEHEDMAAEVQARLYLTGFNIARVFEMLRVQFWLSAVE
jgi:recombination associated protein RdgC